MPDPTPIRILVTGFGAFPGVRSNPSELLLRWIGERRARLPADIRLETALVPATWEAAARFTSEQLAEFDPDIALHFGVQNRCSGFRIETMARNCACPHADEQGKRYSSAQLVCGAPHTLRATLGADKLAARLRAQRYSATTSPSAGRYLCNMLFYLSLHQSRSRAHSRQTGFIHVPPVRSAQMPARNEKVLNFNKETLLAGTEVIINHCIGAQRRALHAGNIQID